MKIAILSDLHIKEKSFGNKFLLNDLEFASILVTLSNRCDYVVLNGDVFELWKTTLPFFSFQDDEMQLIIDQYPATMKAIQAYNVVLLMGNHDNCLKKLSKQFPQLNKAITEIFFMNSKGERFLFWHGHSDFFNRVWPWSGFFFTWLSGLFERIFARGTSDYKGVAAFFKKPFFKNSTQIRLFKKRVRKMKDLVFVANGHTHYPEVKRFQYKQRERIFLNTGVFNKRREIDIIDLETKEIQKIYI